MQQELPSSLICVAPGCTNPRWQDHNGDYNQFCSKRCRNANLHLQNATVAGAGAASASTEAAENVQPGLGPNACVICKTAPYDATRKSLFCDISCAQRSMEMAPGIIEIPQSHPQFTDISNQFQTKWRHTNVPFKPAKHIYFILISAASEAAYVAYRTKVEQEGNFLKRGWTEGNQSRRFYGATRQCMLGDPGNTELCPNQTCDLCEIIRTSFDLQFQRGQTGSGSSGYELYTSATSSKSDSYTTNKTPSPLKAMLMTKVVVGRGYKMTQDDTTRTAPPPGYHSVLREPDEAGSLGYDEVVVYDNDAIRPTYLIVY
ncbi:hypothetical protein FRC19_000441 [Serendipita sp. 401]|nr:hypothetical protein FRC19_000441 [Serendipita sp. 401]KAG9051047.1 hypothetical protein FS842_011255 [Serendipita sp. 407]